MSLYSVMLEGKDQGGRYLVTLDVSASTGDLATEVAMSEAEHRGLNIVAVEECIFRSEQLSPVGVLKVYGRSYFENDT